MPALHVEGLQLGIAEAGGGAGGCGVGRGHGHLKAGQLNALDGHFLRQQWQQEDFHRQSLRADVRLLLARELQLGILQAQRQAGQQRQPGIAVYPQFGATALFQRFRRDLYQPRFVQKQRQECCDRQHQHQRNGNDVNQ